MSQDPNLSPFESIRQQSLLFVDPVFLYNKKLSPISFQESCSDDLPQVHSLPILTQLKNRQVTKVLKPSGQLEVAPGKRVAVLFSGGPAPGGHNVLLGLSQLLSQGGHTLLGIRQGPKGLLSGDLFAIEPEDIAPYKNTGGFHFLGSDRTKIKTPEQFDQVRQVVRDHQLDGLVIIGGDDSNTNAAFLAEALIEEGCTVVGVPKTIDGDVQVSPYLPMSFGFDTATRVYAEMVGNLLKDAASARKYWHFVKVMGRSASHIALQVGQLTQAPLTLISEEIAAKKWSFNDVVDHIVSVIQRREAAGMPFGVVVIPEGVIEFIPDFMDQLSPEIREKLATDLDSHGNPKLSQIDCASLIAEAVQSTMASQSFQPKIITHFYGYEGRCAAPTAWDAELTLHMGLGAAALVLGKHTGVMIGVTKTGSGWSLSGIPLTALIAPVERQDKTAYVIEKTLVSLTQEPFLSFAKQRADWVLLESGISPGPIQYPSNP